MLSGAGRVACAMMLHPGRVESSAAAALPALRVLLRQAAATRLTVQRLRHKLLADGVHLGQLGGVHNACRARAGKCVREHHVSAQLHQKQMLLRWVLSEEGARVRAKSHWQWPPLLVPKRRLKQLANQPHTPLHSLRAPLLEKSKRRRSGSTMEPFWLTWSPSTCGKPKQGRGCCCTWQLDSLRGGTGGPVPSTASSGKAMGRTTHAPKPAHLAQRVVEHVGEGVVGHDLVAPRIVHPAARWGGWLRVCACGRTLVDQSGGSGSVHGLASRPLAHLPAARHCSCSTDPSCCLF